MLRQDTVFSNCIYTEILIPQPGWKQTPLSSFCRREFWGSLFDLGAGGTTGVNQALPRCPASSCQRHLRGAYTTVLCLLQDPVHVLRDLGVDSWVILASAAFTPAGDAHQLPYPIVFANQGAAGISLGHSGRRKAMVESYHSDDSTEEPAPCSKTDAANIFRHILHTTCGFRISWYPISHQQKKWMVTRLIYPLSHSRINPTMLASLPKFKETYFSCILV